jgi:hypothetical protein
MNCITSVQYGWEQKKISFPKNTKLVEILLLQVNYKQELSKNSVDNSDPIHLARNYRNTIDLIITNQNFFKEIHYDHKSPNIILSVDIFNKGFYNMWLSSFSLMSIYLIPDYRKDDLNIEFSFKDKNDMLIKKYTRKVESNFFAHLFLLPIFPFLNSPNGYKNTIDSVFDEAIRDGVFEK